MPVYPRPNTLVGKCRGSQAPVPNGKMLLKYASLLPRLSMPKGFRGWGAGGLEQPGPSSVPNSLSQRLRLPAHRPVPRPLHVVRKPSVSLQAARFSETSPACFTRERREEGNFTAQVKSGVKLLLAFNFTSSSALSARCRGMQSH